MSRAVLIVNFGGPRNLEEIEPFLIELLTDPEVIRPFTPRFFHRMLFKRIAKKRAKKVRVDYALIGGKSPIYEDTEAIAKKIEEKTGIPTLCFHRYLPMTHDAFVQKMSHFSAEEILVFPLFPQFSYATTGSIAQWFFDHLPFAVISKMRWVKSYSTHPAFITLFCARMKHFLESKKVEEKKTLFLYSAHGLPLEFIHLGDIYQKECEASFKALSKQFPSAKNILCYQSKFGEAEWLRPSTQDLCEEIAERQKEDISVVFIPLSFTSDHIETLFEIDTLYLPILEKKGMRAFRCPAIGHAEQWDSAIVKILETADFVSTQMLMRHDVYTNNLKNREYDKETP